MQLDITTKKPIYVIGYPKSATTFLTRLLGDVLDSPTGASVPSQDAKEIATEGQDRPGPFIVRKGHFKLVNNARTLVPKAHHMCQAKWAGQHIAFIVRDPRDICISGAHHWNCPPGEFLSRMIAGAVTHVGRWDDYVNQWLDLESMPVSVVRYEDLLDSPVATVKQLLFDWKIVYDSDRLIEAVKRQSFNARKKQLAKHGDKLYLGKDYNVKFLRSGKAGDWVNHFVPGMNELIWKEFGPTMKRLDYVK